MHSLKMLGYVWRKIELAWVRLLSRRWATMRELRFL